MQFRQSLSPANDGQQSLRVIMLCGVLYVVLQGFHLLLASCVRTCSFECHLCLLSAFDPSPRSLSLATVSIWGGKYLH